MGKATISVPIEITDAAAVSSVLRSKQNARFAVVGATIVGAFSSLINAAKFRMVELASALTGHTVTRTLFVRKSGSRFFVTETDAEGVNIAEEADLRYKSFASFGEFVRFCATGELSMGSTPAIPASAGTPGKITLALPAGSGGTLETDGQLTFGAAGDLNIGPTSTLTDGAGIGAAVVSLLGARASGYVVVEQTMGSLVVDINLTAENDLTGAAGDFGTFARTGYVAPVAESPGLPGNAIYLDQVAGTISFVRVESEPAGTLLLDFEFPEETETPALFE